MDAMPAELNAELPIEVNAEPSAKRTLVSCFVVTSVAVLPNAKLPIEVTLAGMVTDPTLVFDWFARLPV